MKNRLLSKLNKSHRLFNICMKMVSHTEISNHKILSSPMEFVSFAISAGRQSVMNDVRHTVVRLITQLLRFSKGRNMICLWICGVWEF